MRRGRPLKPIISIESVNSALKSLDYGSQTIPAIQALENLRLIDFRLQNTARPAAEDIRGWMLRKILVEMILAAVNQHRRYFDLEIASLNSTRIITLRQIHQDFKTESEHLKGWSLLYCRYVRPELNFSIQELAENTHSHERTLRRYQESTILRLRDKLVDAEWDVRKFHLNAYLRSLIPERIVHLIGRDAEFKSILTAFQEKLSHPIMISGANGTGKSALVASIADYLIEEETIDYLIWVSHPQQISDILNRIHDTILPYSSEYHWYEILQFQQLLLVIDDLEHLDTETDNWQELLIQLQSTFVITINRDKIISKQTVQHITLDNLSRNDAFSLITNYYHERVDAQLTEQLLNEIDANPGDLIHAMQYLSMHGTQSTSDQLTNFYKTRFEALSDAIRVLHLFTMIHGATPDNTTMQLIIGDKTEIIDFEPSRGYANYLQNRYLNDSHLQTKVRTQLDIFLMQDVADTFLLNIASCRWLKLDESIIRRLLQAIDLHNLSAGDANRWRSIFEQHYGLNSTLPETQPELTYRYGVALRRVHANNAGQYLQELTEIFGKTGQFVQQLHTLFELGLLYQAQGQLSRAQEIHSRVKQLLHTYDVTGLSYSVVLQLARIAIEQGDGAAALTHLEGMPLTQTEVYILYCEARFLRGDVDFIMNAIPQGLTQHTLTGQQRASLHTILGRAFQQAERFTEVIIQFNEALSIVEQESTYFDIARARNNLGSSYLMQLDDLDANTIDELEQLLGETKQLQAQLKDTIGQEATSRNLNYLRQYVLTKN